MDWIYSSYSLSGFAFGISLGIFAPKAIRVGIQLMTLINLKQSTKMVLVVRSDLGMGKGKIASQCSHAAIQCFQSGLKSQRRTVELWEVCGQPKIVLKVSSEQELTKLYDKCQSVKNLTCCLIRDAGRTQLDPGTVTVLGIGPGNAREIEAITNGLKLL